MRRTNSLLLILIMIVLRCNTKTIEDDNYLTNELSLVPPKDVESSSFQKKSILLCSLRFIPSLYLEKFH